MRTDLAMVYEDRSDPARPLHSRFGLGVWMNRIVTGHHWIGIRLHGDARTSPLGATIRIVTPGRTVAGVVVAGDSWASQQSSGKIFGLGSGSKIDRVEAGWPDGRTTVLASPQVDRWIVLTPPQTR